MKTFRKMAVTVIMTGLLLGSGPAWAKAAPEDAPGKEGAKTAYELIGDAMGDAANLARQGGQKAWDGAKSAGEKAESGAKKAGEKTVEAGRTAWQAATDEKVQAGAAGALAVGLPAGGAAYLIAAAAGMSNPVTAAAATVVVVSSVMGYQTAQAYDKQHAND